MPIVDWTRTELGFELQNGAQALRFDAAQFAAYDVYMLKRRDAALDYDDDLLARAESFYASLSEDERATLEKSIIAGLPGGEGSYDREGLRAEIEFFRNLGESGLRENLLDCDFRNPTSSRRDPTFGVRDRRAAPERQVTRCRRTIRAKVATREFDVGRIGVRQRPGQIW